MRDISDILALMTHRYPFLILDRVLEMDKQSIRAIKNVTINEPFFVGHFPGRPVMPGVMIVEAMAQAGGFLVLSRVEETDRQGKLIFFTGIDRCRFRRPVVPGDQLVLEVEVVNIRSTFAKIRGRALVDGDVACEADLMSALAEE